MRTLSTVKAGLLCIRVTLRTLERSILVTDLHKELVLIILLVVCIPGEIYVAFTVPSFWSFLAAVLLPIITVQAIIRYIQHRRSGS
jgi:uncharacterized membrane protein (DUF4010 family)